MPAWSKEKGGKPGDSLFCKSVLKGGKKGEGGGGEGTILAIKNTRLLKQGADLQEENLEKELHSFSVRKKPGEKSKTGVGACRK